MEMNAARELLTPPLGDPPDCCRTHDLEYLYLCLLVGASAGLYQRKDKPSLAAQVLSECAWTLKDSIEHSECDGEPEGKK